MLKDHLGELSGKKAIVVGRSNIVGKPMAALLLQESCTVTIAHSRTQDLPGECRQADIVVAAVGRPEMVKGDWIKPGATVIDVGINRIENEDGSKDTRLEVAFAGLEGRASQIIGKIISAAHAGFAPRLTPSEKADWDLFFHMQWRRVPDMHQKVISEAEADANLDDVFYSLRNEVPDRID